MENLNFTDLKRLHLGLLESLARTEAVRDSLKKNVSTIEGRILDLDVEIALLDRVADLFRVLIDKEVIENARTAQDLLTEGMRAIFDDLDLSVRAEVDVQRGKVSVDLVTVEKHKNGTVTEGLSTESYGGSLATIQSVLLRIVVLNRRGLRPLLLLDESLAAVAEHYVPRVGRFLALLSERLGLDILSVSHNPVLVEAATRAYRIQKKDGEASLKQIRTGER